MLFYILIGFVAPPTCTVLNLYFLCTKRIQKKAELALFWITLIVGGYLYWIVLDIFRQTGDWNEQITDGEIHYVLSSSSAWTILVPMLIGLIALILLRHIKAKMMPPLLSAIAIAAILLMNTLHIILAIQLGKNVFHWGEIGQFGVMLYVFHFNILILSASVIKSQLKQQVALFELMASEHDSEEPVKHHKMYDLMKNIQDFNGVVLLCLFGLIAVLEIIFIITGQGVDAPIRAFTETADWTFSEQTPPPPIEYTGHYLCTVAAGGHKKLVKPVRYGKRCGKRIIVNRQLCIANAFEDYIMEKFPRAHRVIRGFYDRHGYPLSKHITTPARADAVYILMKPLEWLFLIFLYLFDTRPERRINRQYR